MASSGGHSVPAIFLNCAGIDLVLSRDEEADEQSSAEHEIRLAAKALVPS